jgi:hypothetical protein
VKSCITPRVARRRAEFSTIDMAKSEVERAQLQSFEKFFKKLATRHREDLLRVAMKDIDL